MVKVCAHKKHFLLEYCAVLKHSMKILKYLNECQKDCILQKTRMRNSKYKHSEQIIKRRGLV